MKKRTVIASTLTASALSAGYAFIDQFSKKVLYRERLDKENQIDWYSELGGVKVKIKNHKDMYLQAYVFEEEGATRTIIGLHGLKQSSMSLKNTVTFLKTLFPQTNVLLYDANAHGLSDGYIRGFGYKDITDLMYFNSYVLQKYGENHKVMMYGRGIGANTILNTAGLDKLKNVELIISEGACSDVYHCLGHLCQQETNIAHHIAEPLIRMIIKKEVKLDIKKINTAELVKHNTIPTVYVHSKNDQNVPFKMVFSLYNQNQSEKFLFPIKEDYLSDLKDFDDEYVASLIEFVNDINE